MLILHRMSPHPCRVQDGWGGVSLPNVGRLVGGWVEDSGGVEGVGMFVAPIMPLVMSAPLWQFQALTEASLALGVGRAPQPAGAAGSGGCG